MSIDISFAIACVAASATVITALVAWGSDSRRRHHSGLERIVDIERERIKELEQRLADAKKDCDERIEQLMRIQQHLLDRKDDKE